MPIKSVDLPEVMSFYYDKNWCRNPNYREIMCLKPVRGYKCSLQKNHHGPCRAFPDHNLLAQECGS